MAAARRDQLRRHGGLLAGGEQQVAHAEHLVLRGVRLVEGRLDVVRERRDRAEREADRVDVVVRQVRVDRHLADRVVVAPVAPEAGVHAAVAALLDDRDQLVEVGAVGGVGGLLLRGSARRRAGRRRRARSTPGRARRRRSARDATAATGAPCLGRKRTSRTEACRRIQASPTPAIRIPARSTPITKRWIWMSPMPGRSDQRRAPEAVAAEPEQHAERERAEQRAGALSRRAPAAQTATPTRKSSVMIGKRWSSKSLPLNSQPSSFCAP